ncbi:MAG: hypothetical protein WC308_02600 [archaeon]|jgi:hypothetical protein
MMLSYHRKNGFLLVIIGFIAAAFAIYFLMGHPSLTINPLERIDDAEALKEFAAITESAGMQNGFSPVTAKMEDYTSELSSLRGKVSEGRAANIIDAELFSAKSYYYLLRATQDSMEINPSNPDCGGMAAKEALIFCDSAIRDADNAIAKISSLSTDDKLNLRETQLEIAQGNKELAQNLKDQIIGAC